MRNQKDSSGSHSHPLFCNPQSLVESCSGIPEGGREENTTLSLPTLSALRMKLAWKTINHSDNERQFKWDSMQVKSKADPWISKELKVRERTLLEKCEEKLIHAKVYSQVSFICWRPHHSCTNVCIAVTSQLLCYYSSDIIRITTKCLFLLPSSFPSSLPSSSQKQMHALQLRK